MRKQLLVLFFIFIASYNFAQNFYLGAGYQNFNVSGSLIGNSSFVTTEPNYIKTDLSSSYLINEFTGGFYIPVYDNNNSLKSYGFSGYFTYGVGFGQQKSVSGYGSSFNSYKSQFFLVMKSGAASQTRKQFGKLHDKRFGWEVGLGLQHMYGNTDYTFKDIEFSYISPVIQLELNFVTSNIGVIGLRFYSSLYKHKTTRESLTGELPSAGYYDFGFGLVKLFGSTFLRVE